jgi:hypothetical protein
MMVSLSGRVCKSAKAAHQYLPHEDETGHGHRKALEMPPHDDEVKTGHHDPDADHEAPGQGPDGALEVGQAKDGLPEAPKIDDPEDCARSQGCNEIHGIGHVEASCFPVKQPE